MFTQKYTIISAKAENASDHSGDQLFFTQPEHFKYLFTFVMVNKHINTGMKLYKFLILCVLFFSTTGTYGQTADDFFISAFSKYSQGDYTGAAEDYTRVINMQADYSNAYFNRAICYEKLKKYEEALNDYTQVTLLLPGDAAAYLNRAAVYETQGKLNLAIVDLDKALELDPLLAAAWFRRGMVCFNAGMDNSAADDLKKFLEFHPYNPSALFQLGVIADKYEEYAEAITYYTRAIQADTTFARAYYNRALDYDLVFKPYDAIADYTKAIALDTAFEDALFNRGCIYDAMNEFESAISDYSRVIELNPDAVDAYYNRGLARISAGYKSLGCEDILKSAAYGDKVSRKFYKNNCR